MSFGWLTGTAPGLGLNPSGARKGMEVGTASHPPDLESEPDRRAGTRSKRVGSRKALRIRTSRSPPSTGLRRFGHQIVPSKRGYSREGRGAQANRRIAAGC